MRDRKAVAKMQALIVVAAIVVAGAGGAYFLSNNSSGGATIDLVIVETNPVQQIDSFSPANITVTHDSSVTLAIQNGDDETRVLQIPEFNINQTIISGETVRVMLTVGAPGVFKMYSPQTPPSPASNGKPGAAITGYVVVN